MAKKTKKGFRNPNSKTELKPQPVKASDLFMGIAQLIMQGLYPATHAKLVAQAVDTLEFFANRERAKENDPANKPAEEEPKEEDKDEEIDQVVEALHKTEEA